MKKHLIIKMISCCGVSAFLSLTFFFHSVSLSQWAQSNTPSTWVYSLAVKGKNIFAGTDSGIFLSADNGIHWKEMDSGLTTKSVRALCVKDTVIFAGAGYNVCLSNDDGANWTLLSAVPSSFIRDLKFIGSNLFASEYTGIVGSTDFGISWKSVGPPVVGLGSFSVANGNMFIGGTNEAFFSDDTGKNWIQLKNIADIGLVTAISEIDSLVYLAGYGGGIYTSTDTGKSWTLNQGSYAPVSTFLPYNHSLFVGAAGGVYLIWNEAKNWALLDSGSSLGVSCLAISDSFLYAGTYSGGVLHCPLAGLIPTSVNQRENRLPDQYEVKQNFPNPFNPTTTIHFELPKESYVQLKLYNILGQNVLIILDENRPAGMYDVQVNAGNLASGIYFYRIKAGNFVQTKKMVLMK